jgi:hypothetical protein
MGETVTERHIMIRIAVLVAVALLVLPATASAQKRTLSISHFFGEFSGGGVAENEDSLYFAVTARDFDVVIGPAPAPNQGGFKVSWTSVIRGGGTVKKPKVRKKSTSRTFIASARPGVFVGRTSGDPLSGKEMSWARIKENNLIVYLMVIDKEGAYQLQRYERKLSGTGMELTFTRLKDGEKVRTVKGRLIKTGR